MNYETGITLYEKIEIKTTNKILPKEMGDLVKNLANFYDIYLFHFALVPLDDRSMDLVWNKEFLDAKNAVYPEYEKHIDLENFKRDGDNILAAFNDARELDHYIDIVEIIPNNLRLRIKRIETNSPIKIELLGLGEVIKEFKEFILSFINLKRDRRNKLADIRRKEFENFEKLLELAKKYKMTPEMVSRASNHYAKMTDDLSTLLDENKIHTVAIEEDE